MNRNALEAALDLIAKFKLLLEQAHLLQLESQLKPVLVTPPRRVIDRN